MPLITIEILPQPYEMKKELAKAITDELNRITGIPKEAVTVVFHEQLAENFAVAGEMLSERAKKG